MGLKRPNLAILGGRFAFKIADFGLNIAKFGNFWGWCFAYKIANFGLKLAKFRYFWGWCFAFKIADFRGLKWPNLATFGGWRFA